MSVQRRGGMVVRTALWGDAGYDGSVLKRDELGWKCGGDMFRLAF